jgi:hypothetical protein
VTIPVSVATSPALRRPEEKLTVLGTTNDPVAGQATLG